LPSLWHQGKSHPWQSSVIFHQKSFIERPVAS